MEDKQQETICRKDAENWIKEAVLAFEEFDEEEPLKATARDVFRRLLVPQFKSLVAKLMQAGLYSEVGDLCRIWNCFHCIAIENQFGEGHALQLSDLAQEFQIWKLE